MAEEVRLGGMALANGVLVHGPNAWACAVRLPDGQLKVASARKRYRASERENPLLRGPARLAEVIAAPPAVRRRMPGGAVALRAAARAHRDGRERSRRPVARGSSALHPPPRSLSPRSPRSPRRRWRCGATSSPPTTAPSTSRSARTSTARRARRSTSAAARTARAAARDLTIGNVLAARAPVHLRALRAASRRWARSPPRPRSSPGWCGNPEQPGRRRRSPSRVTSSSTGWRPRSRLPSSSKSQRPRSPPAWSSSMADGQRLGAASGYRRRSSTSRSRRCARATTPTRTSTTRARRCSRTAAGRASSCRSSRSKDRCSAGSTRRSRSSSSARTTGRR